MPKSRRDRSRLALGRDEAVRAVLRSRNSQPFVVGVLRVCDRLGLTELVGWGLQTPFLSLER